ncbi:MAG: alpha/beta fold hydrolase [Alphaproteobacteria bacterium]|nr:alpha/beta fold hydrolase [Alphaproteobacteria bacterium]
MTVVIPFATFAGDTGTPLGFLHGIGGGPGLWRAQFVAFGATHRCIAWEMPGYGHTPLMPETSFSALAEALGRLMDRAAMPAAQVVGHSMGGMVALEFAARCPARVQSLVLSGSSAAFGGSTGAWQAEFIAKRTKPLDEGKGMAGIAPGVVDGLLGDQPDPAARATAIAAMSAIPEAAYRAALQCLVTFDRRDALAGLAMPVLLLAGQRDTVAPPELMKRMQAKIPGAQYVELPQAGHLANIEQPQAFNAALGAFLGSLQRAAA